MVFRMSMYAKTEKTNMSRIGKELENINWLQKEIDHSLRDESGKKSIEN